MTLLTRLFTVALAAAVLVGVLGSSTWSLEPVLVLGAAVLTSVALVRQDVRLRPADVVTEGCCPPSGCAVCVSHALSQHTG